MLPAVGEDEETACSKWAASRRFTSRSAALNCLALAAQGALSLLVSIRGKIPECLPKSMPGTARPADRETALTQAHFPAEGTSQIALMEARTPALRRLIFEELFFPRTGPRAQAPQEPQAGGYGLRYQR